MSYVASSILKEDWNNTRISVLELFQDYPKLKEEMKTTGRIHLQPYDSNDENIEYDLGNRLLSFIREYKLSFKKLNPPTSKNSQDAIRWLVRLDSNEKKRVFMAFISFVNLEVYLEGYLTDIEYSELVKGQISDALREKLSVLFSIKSFPKSVVGSLYKSDSGIIIPARDLPGVFSDCVGECGEGSIDISSLVLYKYDLATNICYAENSYDTYTEAYSITIGNSLNKEISFDPSLCMPKYGDKAWSAEKELPSSFCKKINSIIEGIVSEKRVDRSYYDCAICKLHMRGDEPVLSFRDAMGTSDYGLAAVILELFSFPVREVYFVLSPKGVYVYGVSNVVRKLNEDGEYTVTIY